MVNRGIITNLPEDAIIEAPGYVDRNGINMPVVGDLPLGCAAVCNQSIDVQRLGVEAAMTGDDTLLRQAVMLDPLTGAVCNPPEIWQMADELLVNLAPWLPQYTEAIREAGARLAEPDKLLSTREGYQGATRIKTKSVEEMELDRENATRIAGESDQTMMTSKAGAFRSGARSGGRGGA